MLDTRRHMELFDADSFNTPIHVIGAGATGSWLVLQLAKLGIKGELIHVYDFDRVEEHNIPNQAFDINQVGDAKVDALAKLVEIATGTKVNVHGKRFTSGRLTGYVFLMIDTMSGRKEIWENSIKMKSAVKLLVEPRMGLDVGRVYNVDPMNMKHIEEYEKCWYSDDEAEVSACGTSMTVITTAMAVSSWCVRQLIEHHAGNELDNEILMDLKYNNIITNQWKG